VRLVVLDTNVIISARVNPNGAPATLLGDWILAAEVQTVTSPAIIREYRDVASRPKFARYGFPPPWLDVLIQESLQLSDAETWPHKLPDPNDLPFLALAHRAGAWLITGNLKHYPAPVCDGVTVISPADYLAYLEGSINPRR
jgi:putative PIN family toxin of toxin-antitoxin system